MVNDNDIKADLDKALDTYRTEVQSIIETSRCGEEIKSDLEQIAKQVFYTFSDFRAIILKHLKNSYQG